MNDQSVITGPQEWSDRELDSARAGVSQLGIDEMTSGNLRPEEGTDRLTIRVSRLGVGADKRQRTVCKSPTSRTRVVGDGMVGSVDELSRENVCGDQTVFMSVRRPKSRPTRFRVPVVAMKPGKPEGAKGHRSVDVVRNVCPNQNQRQ